MHNSFLTYAHFRYLKLALLLVAGSIAAYLWQDPINGPSGGTWVGYGLGGLGTAIILLLLWYGIRKRRFRSNAGKVKGWLSAHVYLGLSLVVIATLHCAFQFGWNIHTLSYALMMLVIVSGLYGTYAYRRYPSLMTENRSGSGPDIMLDELASLEQQAVELADKIDDATHQVVLRSIRNSRIGGGLISQLRGIPAKKMEREDRKAEKFLEQKNETLVADLEKIKSEEAERVMRAESTMMFVAGHLAEAQPGQQVERMRQLMSLLGRRRALVRKLNRDIQHRALLQFWLYLHVPLSIGLLAALTAHIVSVFTYW
jgi:hypothetical protein